VWRSQRAEIVERFGRIPGYSAEGATDFATLGIDQNREWQSEGAESA